jgi:hypothetical protein
LPADRFSPASADGVFGAGTAGGPAKRSRFSESSHPCSDVMPQPKPVPRRPFVAAAVRRRDAA